MNNRNIENRIETDNSKSQEEKEEDEEDEIDDNNKITNYKNKSLSKYRYNILPKKNKKETEYKGEVEYQDNPKGYRFEILEKNPETFTKIIDSENEIVNLEFTIINKSKKHFPGYGSTKILFYKNGIVNIKEISLSQIKPGQKKKINVSFPENLFYGKLNLLQMGIKIEGNFINKPLLFRILNKSYAIRELRTYYEISEKDYSDKELLDILKENDYNADDAYNSMNQ